MEQARKKSLLESLVRELCDERGGKSPAAADADELWATFRALVNTRPAWPASQDFLAAQDELLQGVIAEAGVHGIEEAVASPYDRRMRLWRGDITTLAVDAIVNAANSQMLGCWVPGHYCIDNAIHTYAGVQLRAECAQIMAAQGHDEPTGQAKITAAYNLPSKHVIHTVGPIANGHPSDLHRKQLEQCYKSCLDLAAAQGLASMAFCSISTGVFGFPKREAAQIAVRAVGEWFASNTSDMSVIFNVFGTDDEQIYKSILS